MANPKHLEILKQGAEVWNKWRKANPDTRPDLSGAKLQDLNLNEVDLNLTNFRGANLSGAYLSWIGLNQSDLSDANLNEASIFIAFAYKAKFIGADLRHANLQMVSFSGANFDKAHIGLTAFNDINFDSTIGLDSVRHDAPSSIGIDTIYRSKGHIPKIFLRGCGLSDTFIEYIPLLLNDPLEFYSCFISYSSKDQEYADRLYTDLQNNGVRCWLATEDLKIGDKFRFTIDESIGAHDKLLLVLSEHSVSSQWVEKEVETAMDREREENRLVLFPVRLDNAVMEIKSGWPADVRRTRHIGDFTRWKEHDQYSKAFDRLIHDLKAGK